MRKIVLASFCGLLGIVVSGGTIPHRQNQQSAIPADKELVIALRILNTEQINYLDKYHRFADRDQMLSYLREEPGVLRKLSFDLGDEKVCDLAITTTTDGQHYQISLGRKTASGDDKAACQNSAFSDDRAVIYLGRPLGCDPSAAY